MAKMCESLSIFIIGCIKLMVNDMPDYHIFYSYIMIETFFFQIVCNSMALTSFSIPFCWNLFEAFRIFVKNTKKWATFSSSMTSNALKVWMDTHWSEANIHIQLTMEFLTVRRTHFIFHQTQHQRLPHYSMLFCIQNVSK